MSLVVTLKQILALTHNYWGYTPDAGFTSRFDQNSKFVSDYAKTGAR